MNPTKTKRISPWLQNWQRLRAKRTYRWSLNFIGALIFLALFCRFLANDKPIWCQHEGQTYWPVFQEIAYEWGLMDKAPDMQTGYWRRIQPTKALWPLVPYAPKTADITNHYAGPFEDHNVESMHDHHWLGTHINGEDILATLIWGSRTALQVGLLSMLIAGFIGISLGALAGFLGNQGWRLSRARVIGISIGFFVALFYAFISRGYILQQDGTWYSWAWSILLFLAITGLFDRLFHWLWRGKFGRQSIAIPVDALVMRLIEVLTSIPALLLLLAFASIIKEPTLLSVILIIGLLSWTTMARFVRGEMLRIRNLEYIEAARTLGLSRWRILWYHALPNALGPALITIAFGVAAAVLLEAYLSFLNIGMPDVASWGRMLANVRERPSAWWLAIFPGLVIFLTITSLNLLGEGLTEMRRRS